MRFTKLESFTVAIPFIAPIFSAYGVSYPARISGDAIYPEYVDDVLVGGKLPIAGGQMRVPQAPGLGVDLDEHRLAQYALTPQKLHEFDQFWQQVKADYAIAPAGHDLLVRHF